MAERFKVGDRVALVLRATSGTSTDAVITSAPKDSAYGPFYDISIRDGDDYFASQAFEDELELVTRVVPMTPERIAVLQEAVLWLGSPTDRDAMVMTQYRLRKLLAEARGEA